MKKVFLVFAILLANGVFTSCTELEENPENLEIFATDGEEEQDPEVGDDDDDLVNLGGGN
tara:strand:- start:4361 stop:4540 length:180 start_codon:yes stop_codon:yes gene_type:complete